MNADTLGMLREAWTSGATLTTAQRIIAAYEARRDHVPLRSCRVAIARTFAVEPLVPLLRAAGYLAGLALDVYVGPANAQETELLEEGSALYAFAPQIVILAVDTPSMAPSLWRGDGPLEEAAARVRERLERAIVACRAFCTADLIVHGLDAPDPTLAATPDGAAPNAQRDAVRAIDAALAERARACKGVWLLDYDALIARHGRRTWRDAAKWERFQIPAAAANLRHIVDEWMRFIQPLTGAIAKVAAVDLDNTLWGGVVGEEGVDGVQVGAEYPGTAYRAVQGALLTLRERGILLAICSKNNVQDAHAVFERHPEMLLRREHFAAEAIGWDPKSGMLARIAEQLGFGLDAVALVDDLAAERVEAVSAFPQLRTVALGDDPARYAHAILEAPCFARLALSDEDRSRAAYYREETLRRQALGAAASREEFLRSLGIEVEIEPAAAVHDARVAQLTQKTNQFNLTATRYSQAQIAALRADAAYSVVVMKVRDHFGDSGLVGVAIVRDGDDAAMLETFLLSCRVIGRGVETALLATIAREAVRRGHRTLRGRFVETPQNAPAREFFGRHGFRRIAGDDSAWELDLERERIAVPEHIRVRAPAGAP